MNSDETLSVPVSDPRIAFFDGLAPTWDQTGPKPAATLCRLLDLKAHLDLRPGLDLLELGCGTGQITGWLADCLRPGRVVAADFSPAMLAQARARGVDAEFIQFDICREQAVDPRFDVVLCFHSFPHFRDQAAALRQIARLLRAGGRLLVLHLVGSAELNAFHRQVGGAVSHDRLPPAVEWPALLEAAGLQLADAVDREDLFLVKAAKADGATRSGSSPCPRSVL